MLDLHINEAVEHITDCKLPETWKCENQAWNIPV